MPKGDLHTKKKWPQLLRELDAVMRRWGNVNFLPPIYDVSLKAGNVTLRVAVNGEYIEVICAKFSTPEQNFLALIQAIEQYRKDEARGITGLYLQLAKVAALKAGPPKDSPYRVLGVPEGADIETCRTAFRNLAKTTHPDAGGTTQEWLPIRNAAEKLGVL